MTWFGRVVLALERIADNMEASTPDGAELVSSMKAAVENQRVMIARQQKIEERQQRQEAAAHEHYARCEQFLARKSETFPTADDLDKMGVM